MTSLLSAQAEIALNKNPRTQIVGRTSRARTLLAAIRLTEHGRRLTVRTIAAHTGLGSAITHYHLNRLQDDGLITGLGTPGGLRVAVRRTR